MGNGVNLFQFIVPLTFLAIWALTSLINREAQPLPPRTGRPPGPPRPRPGGGPPSLGRPPERRVEPFSRDASTRRPMPANQGRPAPPQPGAGGDDGILIIESESRKPTLPPGSRRGSRSRSASVPAPKREEKVTPRALTASMGEEAAANQSRNRELTPLTKMLVPLSVPVSQEVAATPHTPARSASLSALTSQEIMLLLKTPAKLREAIILNELIQPPLALRGKQARRI